MAQGYGKFRKCALQVNPWHYAKEFQGADHGLDAAAYNLAVAQRCLANGIEVVGIADHGSVDGVDDLRSALENEGIVVFPGFEIASTEKVHMVCLYPAATSVATLNQYLGALGMPIGGAKTAPSSLGCRDIAEKVHKQGGFWYAAHATGASGLLRLQQDGGGLQHIWRDSELVLAAQIAADVDAVQEVEVKKILQNKNANYRRERPIALLNAKDVRQPSDLDHVRACSWIKMTPPTLDALRLACRDPESRVRLGDQIDPTYYSRIDRIVFKRGYLEDMVLDLSPNLNAIVGGRGTGKSTLIEAIRYVLQAVPISAEARKVHTAIIDANFAKEKAGIEITVTSFQHNCEQFVISRLHGSPATVVNSEGDVLPLSPRDLLPKVEIFGQNELLAIVQDEQAKAKLLGRFLAEDEQVQGELATLRQQLRVNREELDKAEDKLAQMDEQLLQLPVLAEKVKSLEKLGLKAELEQVKVREARRAYLTELEEQLQGLSMAVEEFEAGLEEIELPAAPADGASTGLTTLAEVLIHARSGVSSAAVAARSAVTTATQAFTSQRTALIAELVAEEKAFYANVDTLPALKGKKAAELATEYKRLTGDVAKLGPVGAQRASVEGRRQALTAERATLLQRFDAARSARWTALSKGVKQLNRRLDGQLRIEFEPERVRQPLTQFLLACQLPGVAERRLSWIDDAETLSVATLVQRLGEGSEALLTAYKEAGMQRAVAEAISALPKPTVRKLEELELPERIELLLNVSREGQLFREVGRLSTGQQCTAVLHLLLLDNRDPLVIDQPEDNLDNAFIAEHIVNELRVSKTRRQYLFATHNANIPVFGDAEWIGVLQEEDGHAKIVAAGSIDQQDVKDLAAAILEGGRDAFNRRREKYGL